MNEVTALMMIRNEDRFIWYSVNSILPFVSKCLITDTGSTDKTIEILSSIKSPKIVLTRKNKVTPSLLTDYRMEQIKDVKKGWVWLVDGDEVYSQNTATRVNDLMNNEFDGIIVHRYDLIGDIYHYQNESVGSYNQFGKIGHYVLRALNKDKLPRLEVLGDYPNEYFAERGINVKVGNSRKFAFVKERLFHAMYLQRSSMGSNLKDVVNRQKYKIELGNKIDRLQLPEVFFKTRPLIVPDVTGKRSLPYFILAQLLTPLKKLKRIIFN